METVNPHESIQSDVLLTGKRCRWTAKKVAGSILDFRVDFKHACEATWDWKLFVLRSVAAIANYQLVKGDSGVLIISRCLVCSFCKYKHTVVENGFFDPKKKNDLMAYL